MELPVAVTRSIISSGILNSLVLPIFVFRLWIRIRRQRVGWEDIWATIAFICGMLNVASNWVSFFRLKADQPSTTAMWIYVISLTCLVWAVRVSIIFSIIRILPANERLHLHGLIIISFFLLTCLVLIVQRAISCSYAYRIFQSSTPNSYFSRPPPHSLSISELAVGAVADIITIVFPLYVLRGVTLPRKQLRLLRLLFSSNITVSILCGLRTAFQLIPSIRSWAIIITDIQIATCLIVCNLVVVVTYLYCMLRCRKRGSTRDVTVKETTVDNSASTPSSVSGQMTLTTIELWFSTHSDERTSESDVTDEAVA